MLEALRAELGPQFSSPEQRIFFDSEAPEILYSGWMGAGKSRIICEKVWHLALRYPEATFGIFRKTQASLAATTERTFWRDVADPSKITNRNKTEHWVEVTGGARIYFLGLDPDPITGVPSKVGSLDLACAYVDEAVECTEGDWIMLLGRLRDPRMPYHQLGAATNPASPIHWLKQRFTPPTEERVYLQASTNRFLTDAYLRMLAGLPGTPEGDRLGRGLWVAAQGAIYNLPSDQIIAHDLSRLTWKNVVAGIDWGFVHAFACEVVGQTGSGRLAVLRELYERNRLLEDLIPVLKAMQARYHISTFYADPSEPEYIATCQRAGLPVIPATNDVLPGINAVATAISTGMTIDRSCTGLLAELPSYTWASDKQSGGLKEKPVEIGDDACDALRYAVMGLTAGGVLLHI